MIEKIQTIFNILGIVSCAVCAVLTGEIGFFVATIWAIIALFSHT